MERMFGAARAAASERLQWKRSASRRSGAVIRTVIALTAAILVAFIVIPLAGLFFHLRPADVIAALQTPVAQEALRLSIVTTLISLVITLAFGTPLAFVLARGNFPGRRLIDAIVDLPIVVPPAVAGLSLLLAFGRFGTFGPALGALGIHLSFSTAAVVMAQTFVSSPFYVRSARAGFTGVDRTLEAASATLGMGPLRTFAFITVPLSAPSLIGGGVLAWARALGEFGATIMFAGNLAGVSQTLPLAVYLNLESGNLPIAVVLSVILVLFSLFVVIAVRAMAERGGNTG
jgi:molybdate transport system permease protein